MEISIHSHGLEAICGLGEYLYRTHPLNISIYVKADSCLNWKAKADP